MDSIPKSVLIVDDESDICELLRFEFEGKKHQVATAMSVSEALERLRVGRFDIVFTDIGLPDGSGLEILAKAKGTVPRIYLMTAQAKITQQEAVALGARKIFGKPFDFAAATREILDSD